MKKSDTSCVATGLLLFLLGYSASMYFTNKTNVNDLIAFHDSDPSHEECLNISSEANKKESPTIKSAGCWMYFAGWSDGNSAGLNYQQEPTKDDGVKRGGTW